MIQSCRSLSVGVALAVGVDAWAGLCPQGSETLQVSGPAAFEITCTDATGATGCWEPPSGACELSNTVTVEVDGDVIHAETFPGTGASDVCNSTVSLIGHYFTTGDAHTVVETTTAPAATDSFTVTVLPGPPCDADGDGVVDSEDNCVWVANSDQTDTDLDRRPPHLTRP